MTQDVACISSPSDDSTPRKNIEPQDDNKSHMDAKFSLKPNAANSKAEQIFKIPSTPKKMSDTSEEG